MDKRSLKETMFAVLFIQNRIYLNGPYGNKKSKENKWILVKFYYITKLSKIVSPCSSWTSYVAA